VLIALFASSLGHIGQAQALTLHGDFAGGTVDFFGVTETSATDATPLYGAPSVFGNSLAFFPASFASSSSGGSSDVTEGTLTITITAKPGFFIDKISIIEFGDFSLSGIGTSSTFASVSGALDITDLTFASGTYTDPLAVSPTMPVDLSGGPADGLFSGSAMIDLAGLGLFGVTSVFLEFENVLETGSESGTSAFIQKKLISGTTITVDTIIPEPSALVIWSLLGLSLSLGTLWRRRKVRVTA
jgi:hypothetical protein